MQSIEDGIQTPSSKLPLPLCFRSLLPLLPSVNLRENPQKPVVQCDGTSPRRVKQLRHKPEAPQFDGLVVHVSCPPRMGCVRF